MKLKRICLGLLIPISFLITGQVMATEEPKYVVEKTDAPFEVRKYAPILIAETTVEGDMDQASSQGFRVIADFIFGNNAVGNQNQSEKIAMTAPVVIEPQSAKIEMTAPVTIAPQQAAGTMETAKIWRVQFVMPSTYSLANIPKPKNDAVRLKEIPSTYFVVMTYSWLNGAEKVQKNIEETLIWAKKNDYQVIGTPQLARYNPPWTLPMFRRNEIMVEIAEPKK